MKIQVLCKTCGRKVCEVNKPQVSDADITMYEQSSACEEHGPNIYEYDEEGTLISSEIHVIAVRSED